MNKMGHEGREDGHPFDRLRAGYAHEGGYGDRLGVHADKLFGLCSKPVFVPAQKSSPCKLSLAHNRETKFLIL